MIRHVTDLEESKECTASMKNVSNDSLSLFYEKFLQVIEETNPKREDRVSQECRSL
jgi:hypothetical protein